tara:strand:- start:23 stop:310 length:288 start_codon:yes stop_codon:yes gene_type:complete
VEIFGIIILMNLCIFGYFAYSFIQYRKREKYRTQELNHRVQCMLDEMERDYQASLKQEEKPVTNIFREHIIDEISKQRLIYDKTTGRYIKLRQIE